ncbi:hypothetical protein Phi4:1_gp142 [Cellulophaga phage phi4:1]|uniref:Uncharacterized protein n=5 Tax=Lightbulbvirus TaxID=1918522 RepID=A0A0S2MWV2_9CAUD|nr:hypothetical protein Phi4:1_gp142 [Cellulophaga phage phi4:1]YP_008241641.1 hypothetical protein Phi17:2_gp146 [Cellulophaga phage phi17:2]ALO80151.1 hypothetical protein Phi4113_142 [Cellulophaga phage phi4:1_13]ALO80348.1 hypothetical protein Phi4118_142 [Cellulophaga phage phi4:1_18]ALO80549.1 hypothetical protein Phi17218_146 [Cellulophaga phage phi17:2_18]AGO47679.1 hypothetical protein Phi17:2_gp146 [Cellulophaga phage phi17:2]AGO49555.1 hypothetical protein Phi4:1_gp142 [Cellulophag
MLDFVKKVLEDKDTFGGFEIVSYKQGSFPSKEGPTWYGKAKDRTGMTIIHWNTEGHCCTYFGEELKPNISVCISKDGDTRTVFNGYCFTKTDLKKVLKLTW